MVASKPSRPMHDGFGTVYMKVAAAVTAGDMVVLGTDGVSPAADACTTGIFGIARTSGAADAYISVSTWGVFIMDLATSFDPDVGDLVYAASDITVDAGGTGDVAVGIVVGTDPSSGTTAEILIDCAQAHPSITVLTKS